MRVVLEDMAGSHSEFSVCWRPWGIRAREHSVEIARTPATFWVAFCAIASSPAWHRRCRKHRSSARRRLRQGSSTRRDRKLLLAHHATPPSQALALMAWRGSTGKGAGSKGDNGPSKGSGKWQYWQGSWSPSTHNKGAPWKKNHGKAQEGKTSLSFPGYDVAKKEEQPILEMATIKERDGDSYATALQRAINHVRKAEARTRKALADKKSRTVQWNNWITELKRTFAKEKGRYQTAVSRLEREMEEALVEQECARAGLRRVAASMEVDAGPALPEHVDAGAEFEALMQDGIGLEEPQESNEDILKRTLQRGDGKREMAVTRTPETDVVTTPPPKRSLAYSLEVSTPLRERLTQLPREVQPLQMSVASASPEQVPAGSDPYMVSPSTTSRRSSPATSTRKKISTPDGNGREGVKAAVRPVAPKHMLQASQSLADKLEARRAALAMERPDLRSSDSPGQLQAAATGTAQIPPPVVGEPPPTLPQHHILYDDEEEREPSESDLEAWYNGYCGAQDLQTLE